MLSLRKRRKNKNTEIAPDEIFLDSRNLPQFDVHQFEGRFEKPITKKTVFLLGGAFVIIAALFGWRVWDLQIVRGAEFNEKSENNRLERVPIFAERGVVYDRNGVELAWNIPYEGDAFARRAYLNKDGLAHLLGYVKYPRKDERGFYYRTDLIGEDGVEKYYNDELSGENGTKIIEVDALMNIRSENIVRLPVDGENITLSIDAEVQSKLYELMRALAEEKGFLGGAGVILSVENGEILALSSYPEYDPDVLSDGEDAEAIRRFQSDVRKPFLDRVVSGLYTPGSIVKPFVALGALNEKVITPQKKILSTGSISIPNPYYPERTSIFTDWKAHGWVDVKKALAVSSNVYFYEVGGGFEDQKGIGIAKIKQYVKRFGIGDKTGVDIPGEVAGVIPSPEWKEEVFGGEKWRIGDTYNTAIGQYGFQVTPIQMARAVAAIANDGKLVTPHINKDAESKVIDISNGIDKKYFTVVKEGMRMAVTSGTAKGLNVSYVSVAAKTGTAELGVSKKRVNSWIVGFYPYERPRFAFAVVMERGPRENLIGGLYIMRHLLDWMYQNKPEYVRSDM